LSSSPNAAFQPSLGLARREALWAIKPLRDNPLPLFAAVSAWEETTVPEINEPVVALKAMTLGGEVIADYSHVGLTLRDHPPSFLREDLRRRRIVTCAEAMQSRDGKWLEAAGPVLVRQRPGSAKGVLFVTIEHETGIANLVIWAKVFEKYRRIVLGAEMLGLWADPEGGGCGASRRSSAYRSLRRTGKRRGTGCGVSAAAWARR
jgi:error-prone DNA polymerase